MEKRGLIARLGFSALKHGLAPPRLVSLARYREQWFLKSLLLRLEITLVIDVGANDGRFAEGLRLLGYGGRIASFEPIPAEVKAMKVRAAGDDKWQIFGCALGNEIGTADFGVIEEGGGRYYSSFLKPTGAPPVARVIRVPVTRLDAIWQEIVVPGEKILLKTDTQGFDMHVLQGAGPRLQDVACVMTEANVIQLYEGAPHYLETLAFLEGWGFSLLDLRVIDRTAKGAVLEYDCIMARV